MNHTLSRNKSNNGKCKTNILHNSFITLLLKKTVPSVKRCCLSSTDWPRGYKTFFMLNSVEHEILNAHKCKNVKKFGFLGSGQPRILFFPLIDVKMPTINGF